LNRIYDDQLRDLLLNQHIFRQFSECTGPYIGKRVAGELAEWMAQCYVAFATTAVRRMVEEPSTRKGQKSISLVVLLRDLAAHSNELTIERYRWLCRRSLPEVLADRIFARISGKKTATRLSSNQIEQDIRNLKRAAEPTRRLVNKIIAHTEEDRRLWGKISYGELNAAIALLSKTFQRYELLITGIRRDPIVPFNGYDVRRDLNKIWPKPDH
jgi:hypothetical protein